MASNGEGRLNSRARQHLLLLLRATTRTALAKRIGVERATLGHWAAGRHAPDSYEIRVKCREELGIDPAWWDMPPANDVVAVAS